MAEFHCRVADTSGRIFEQVETARTEAEARQHLADRGLLVYSVRPRLGLPAFTLRRPKKRRRPRADGQGVAALGLGFFGRFFVRYNIAIGYATAARAGLALSRLPPRTTMVGALLSQHMQVRGHGHRSGVRRARCRSGLAPPGAWRSELITAGAVPCSGMGAGRRGPAPTRHPSQPG